MRGGIYLSLIFGLGLLAAPLAHARDLYQACLSQRADATHNGVFDEKEYFHQLTQGMEVQPKHCCICVTATIFDADAVCKGFRKSGCDVYAQIPYAGSFSAAPYPDTPDFRGCTTLNVDIHRHGAPEAGALIRQSAGMACVYGAIQTNVVDHGCSTFGDPHGIERYLADPVDNRALLLSDQRVFVTANQSTVLYDLGYWSKKGIAPVTKSPFSVRLTQGGYKMLRHPCAEFGAECGAPNEAATCEDDVEIAGKNYKFGLDLMCCPGGTYWNGDPYYKWVRGTACPGS